MHRLERFAVLGNREEPVAVPLEVDELASDEGLGFFGCHAHPFLNLRQLRRVFMASMTGLLMGGVLSLCRSLADGRSPGNAYSSSPHNP